MIPIDVREHLSIDEGDELAVVVEAKAVRLVPRKQLVEGLRGSLASAGVDVVEELLADRRSSARADAP